MSSKKKSFDKQFQQNKVNRVEKSEAKYNKEKRSKSDEAYIKGDYKSSVSLRSYGVKKALAEGKKVSGYGDDYIDTKGMKRSRYVKKQNGENPYEAKYLYVGGKPNTITSKDGSKFKTRTRYLTDEEKKSYENTGELYHKNYRKAKSYLDTERHEGGKFSDRLKTFDGNKIKWDGLETAKYNQKDGKHLQNLGHYAIGLGKDLIADPVVDFLKGVDRYESAITNGAYAVVEQLSNIADGKGATKDLIKDVVKHSFKESDETGWGTSSADNWRNMAKRNGAKISPLEDKILGATGFVADILNPIDLGGKVSNVLKGTAKGAKNALKGVSSATDVMSEVPGFVPKSLTDVRGKNFINKTNKSNGASDDVFFGLKTNKSLDNTQIDRRLNNAYDVAMSKREPIKTGRSKLDSFIARLDANNIVPISEVNQNPMKTSNPMDIKFRRKGNSEESGMFPHNTHQFNVSGNTLEALDSKYRDVLTMQGDDLVDYIDNLPDREYDKVIDYIQKKDLELYETLMYESDVIDDTIESTTKRLYETQEDKKFKEVLKSENKRDIKINKQDNMPSLMAHEMESKIVDPRKIDYKKALSSYNSLGKKLPTDLTEISGDIEMFREMLEILPKGNSKADKKQVSQIINKLNDRYFDKKDVISLNASGKDVRQLVEHLDVLLNKRLSGVSDELISDIDKHYKYRPSLVDPNYNNKLNKRSEIFGTSKNKLEAQEKVIDLQIKEGKISPLEGKMRKSEIKSKIKELQDWWSKYSAYTPDEWEKEFSTMNKEHKGYHEAVEEYSKKDFNLSDVENYKQDLRDSLEIDELVKSEFPYDMHVREVIENEPELLIDPNQKKILQDSYRQRIERLKETHINKMVNEEFGLDIKDEINGEKLRNQKRNLEARQIGENLSQAPLAEKELLNGVGEIADNKNIKARINHLRQTLKLNTPKKIKGKIKLTNGQKLKDLPPVQDNLKGLRDLITKEVEYRYKNANNYSDMQEAFKVMKREYVDALRQLGVPDKGYFHKVQQLQKDLDIYFKELNNPTKVSTPFMKMDLQKLARKIDDTFNEIGEGVYEAIETPLEKVKQFDEDVFESDFEKFAYEDYMREHKSQEKKGLLTKKEEVERIPKTNEQVKSIEDKLKLLTETYGDVNLEKKNLDIDVPSNVDPQTGEILSNQNKGIKEVFEELSSKGIDVTKQPPKEKPQNMDKNLYQKWLNAWKKGVTIYNPGWHMQNFFQNKAQNYFALGNKAFMPQTDAKNILKTIKGKDAKSVNINGMGNNELAKLAQNLGVVDSFGDDIQLAQNGFLGKLENSWIMQKPQEIEKNARLHHWLEQMKNGMTPEQAAQSVNKYLYDYSKENKFDRAIKHVDPFWTFHKNNARMLTTSAIEHPSRMNNIMRANRGLEGDIPEEYKQSEEAMYREYQDPTKTYTDHKDRQYNYLYNQDVFSDISDAIPLSKDSLVGKLNPLIQIALRTAMGEGKFGNKIVDSDKSIEDGWNELLYEDAGYNKVSSNVAIKDALLDVNPILPGLVETIDAINADKYKANNGGMPQEIADKRALNEWIKLITGHKGNWYRNTK